MQLSTLKEELSYIQRGDIMVGIKIKQKGDFSKFDHFLAKLKGKDYLYVAEKYAKIAVQALKEATPKDTGHTAECWDYRIEDNQETKTTKITFTNSNVVDGYNIAILLQYGHGTRNGGYVMGRDYINPVIQPLFEEIANEAWEEVIKL